MTRTQPCAMLLPAQATCTASAASCQRRLRTGGTPCTTQRTGSSVNWAACRGAPAAVLCATQRMLQCRLSWTDAPSSAQPCWLAWSSTKTVPWSGCVPARHTLTRSLQHQQPQPLAARWVGPSRSHTQLMSTQSSHGRTSR
jgi:hypothetical protein